MHMIILPSLGGMFVQTMLQLLLINVYIFKHATAKIE